MNPAPEPKLPARLAAAPWLAAPPLQAVLAALAAAGLAARAVGGCVRNALMDLPVADVDIATPAEPEAVMRAATAAGLAAIPTGLAHGTVTIVSGGHGYEVTTLRRDVATDGRRATIAFTDDWTEDARRRDFTINALYCDGDGTLHDPLDGYGDLLARRVRFIGDPDARIREDYLRILRFFRFYAAFGAEPADASALAAAVRNRQGLRQLSSERIRAELLRLLTAPRATAAIDLMTDHGLLAPLLGLSPRPGILRQAIAAEAALGLAPDAMHRLSALALAVSEDGPRLARRLRLSNDERHRLVVVDQRLAACLAGLDDASARRQLYLLGDICWRRDVLALAALGPPCHAAAQRLWQLAQAWPRPTLPVRGADVLALGIAPGPAVGEIMGRIEDWWVAADFPPADAVRAELAAMVAARGATDEAPPTC